MPTPTTPSANADNAELATFARSQLRRFDQMQTRRRSILGAYRAALEPAGLRFVPEIEDPGSARRPGTHGDLPM